MHPELHRFLSRIIGTFILTLIPVIFVAFVSMAIGLDRQPGEPAPKDLPLRHMTKCVTHAVGSCGRRAT
jgi:hypothetical protein